MMKKKKRPDEESTPLAETFITGGIVVRGTLKNFERLIELIEENLPEVKLVYRKISLGNLYIREEKPPRAEERRDYLLAR